LKQKKGSGKKGCRQARGRLVYGDQRVPVEEENLQDQREQRVLGRRLTHPMTKGCAGWLKMDSRGSAIGVLE